MLKALLVCSALALAACSTPIEKGVGSNLVATAVGSSVETARANAKEKAAKHCNLSSKTHVLLEWKNWYSFSDSGQKVEMIFQCGQDTKSLLKINSDRCDEEGKSADLDPIREKVEIWKRLFTPVSVSMSSNENYPTETESAAILQWQKIRGNCLARQAEIRSRGINAGFDNEMQAINDRHSFAVDALITALYQRKLTYGEFSSKRAQYAEEVESITREITSSNGFKISEMNSLRIIFNQRMKKFVENSSAYIKEVNTRKPLNGVANELRVANSSSSSARSSVQTSINVSATDTDLSRASNTQVKSNIAIKGSATQPDANGDFTITISTGADTASLKIDGDELGGKRDGNYVIKRVARVGEENSYKITARDVFGNTDSAIVTVARQVADSRPAIPRLNPANVRVQQSRDAESPRVSWRPIGLS